VRAALKLRERHIAFADAVQKMDDAQLQLAFLRRFPR